MLRYILLTITTLTSSALYAHQPDRSSTMLVEKAEGEWILQVRAALTAFEYEVHVNYGEDSYKTPEEFNGLVLDHLRNNIYVVVNKDTISLKGGNVKLGHETSVIFELEEELQDLQYVSVIQNSFVDVNRNQSALVLLKKGLKPQQFIMNQSNDHQMDIEFSNNEFVARSQVSEGIEPHSHVWQYVLGIALLLFLVLVVCYWIRRNPILS